MQYTKQDIFNELKDIVLETHPEILPEQITKNASFFQHLRFDGYDMVEIIIRMEQKFKLLNNNINHLKQFTYVNEFCDEFFNILSAQSPEMVSGGQSAKISMFGFMRRFFVYDTRHR